MNICTENINKWVVCVCVWRELTDNKTLMMNLERENLKN